MNNNNSPLILIVDDVPKNIQVVGNILREEGYRIAYALDGTTALELVNNNNFDLILLDVMMPEMDGFTLCSKIKEIDRYKDIPVIFLTAKNDHASLLKGFEIGGVDYVTKPFRARELLVRVNTHVRNKTEHQMLVESVSEFQNMSEKKDKFFSIIAHDMRNPLAAFKSIAELLDKSFDEMTREDIRSYIATISESADRLYDLFQNLMSWSRSKTNSIVYSPQIISLDFVITNVIDLIQINAEKKNIDIYTNYDQLIEFYADVNMLATVLRNLISNAIKFTNPNGLIEIDVKKENDNLHFIVKDNGVGIPQDKITKLFDYHETKSTVGTSGEKGTGLGLLLCEEFVSKHNGKIWAESQFGHGTQFHFIIPKNDEI